MSKHSLKSSGISDSNSMNLFEVGCIKPKLLAWRACLGNTLKQLSTNCLYLVNVVPLRIKFPPYLSSLNKVCPINFKCTLIWCVLPVSSVQLISET